MTDTTEVGGATIKDFQLVGVDSAATTDVDGVFGIGLKADTAGAEEYDTWPYRLRKDGIIDYNAYSLYLDDLESPSGSVLFGGYDSAKVKGELRSVPLVEVNNPGFHPGFTKFNVDVRVSANDGSDSQTFEAVLDSGASFTYLPDDVISQIASDVGAVSEWGYYFFYSKPSPDAHVTFNFSGQKITVPASELAIPLNRVSRDPSASEVPYLLPFLPSSSLGGVNILGDSFLRSAYVVYDLENLKLHLAQANVDATTSTIVAIPSSGPDSQPAPGF